MESTVIAAATVSLSTGAGVTTAELLSGWDTGGALVSTAEAAAGAEETGAECASDADEAVEEEEIFDVDKASVPVAGTEETGAASLLHGCKINKRMTVSNKTAKTAQAANNSCRRFRMAGDVFFL